MLGNGQEQGAEVKGLGQKNDLTFADFPPGWVMSTYQDGWNTFKAIKLVKLVMQFEAIHVGKHVVEDEEMRAMGLDGLEGLGATGMAHDGMGGFTLNELDDEQANILSSSTTRISFTMV